MTMLWCAGAKLAARLFEGLGPERACAGSTVVRHKTTGSTLRFESEHDARRFIERHCCEPKAYELICVDDEGASDRAA